MNKIGIVIVDYNGKKDTEELLQSLVKADMRNFDVKVVVVNNGVDDLSSLTTIYRGVEKIINNQKNVGFARANNQGIKYLLDVGAEFICLLNNDTIVKDNFLSALVGTFAGEKVGIVCPKIYFYPGCEFHKKRYAEDERGKVIWYAGGEIDWDNVYCRHRGVDEMDRGQFDQTEETDFATGCAMMIKREILEKIGSLDEKYFAYLEDVDFCWRAREARYKIIYCPKSIIWHKNASSSGGPGSPLHYFLQERNRLYFGFKYASFKIKLHLLQKMFSFLFSSNYKIVFSLMKMFL